MLRNITALKRYFGALRSKGSVVCYIILKSIVCFSEEIISLLPHKLRPNNSDPARLYMFVKARAHHLEKALWHPAAFRERQGEWDSMHEELKQSLLWLEQMGVGVPPPIVWAQRIVREYEKYRADQDNQAGCPIAGGLIPSTPKAHKMDWKSLMGLIKSRRSRRIFTDEPLSREEKDLLIEAALWAPSACNRQTHYYVFVQDADNKAFIARSIAGGFPFAATAPSLLLVVADRRLYRYPDERVTPFQDTGAAVQNIQLIAETLGIGCCWCSFTSFGGILGEKEIRKLLHIPDHMIFTAILALGKSTQIVCPIPRDRPSSRYFEEIFPEEVYPWT